MTVLSFIYLIIKLSDTKVALNYRITHKRIKIMLDCFIAYAIRNDVVTLRYCFRHCERSEAIYRIYRGKV